MIKKGLIIFFIGMVVILTAVFLWKLSTQDDGGTGFLLARSNNAEDVTLPATPTDFPPTPSETLFPMRELPTPELTILPSQPWIGAVTYAAESTPGYDFRLDFDPSVWALTFDEMGNVALFHRDIPYCKIIPTVGRGTPRDWTVDDQFKTIGLIRYEVVTVSQAGVVQFVNYFGGDGVILTGFQVSSQAHLPECYPAAEIVLGTLSSSLVSSPIPTLTSTP